MTFEHLDRKPALVEDRINSEVESILGPILSEMDDFTRKSTLSEIRSDAKLELDLVPDAYKNLPKGMEPNEQDLFSIGQSVGQELRRIYKAGANYTIDDPESRTNISHFERWSRTFYLIVTNKKRDDTSLMPANITISAERPTVLSVMEEYNAKHPDKPKYLFTTDDLRAGKIAGLFSRNRRK